MRVKSAFLLILALVVLSSSAIAWNYYEFEQSDINTHQQYKGDTLQTGLVHATNPQTITGFTSCSISEGQAFPIPVDDFTGDGKGDVVIDITNYLRLYNSSCSLQKSYYTGRTITGYPIIYPLFDDTTPALIVPETNGNISIYEYSMTANNFIKRVDINGQGGLTNVGFVCDRLSSGVDRPTCYYITNNNSLCAFSTTNAGDLRDYTSWASSCIGLDSNLGIWSKKRIPALNVYDYDGVTGLPKYSLVFGYDADNDTRGGLGEFALDTFSWVSSFGINGAVDDIYKIPSTPNCNDRIQYAEFYDSMSTPMVYDLDDDGLGEIVVTNFTETSNYPTCSVYAWTLSATVFKSDGSSNSITLTNLAGASTPYPPSVSEATAVYYESTHSGVHFCISYQNPSLTPSTQNNRKCFYYTGSSIVQEGHSTSEPNVLTNQHPLHQLSFRNITGTYNLDTMVDTYSVWDGLSNNNFFNLTPYSLKTELTVADITGDGVSDIITTQSGSSVLLSATGYAGSNTSCGNLVCEFGETYLNCATDCPIPTCGNSICDATETFTLCPTDCLLATCGDSVCNGGETNLTCPYDCTTTPPVCGDGICNGGETLSSCPIDCHCGNGVCESALGETNSNCPTDCSFTPIQTVNGSTPSMNIPTQLVNPNNVEQGLLPEIYYGIVGFFQPIMIPLMYILVMVMLIMLFVGIATLIKKHTE